MPWRNPYVGQLVQTTIEADREEFIATAYANAVKQAHVNLTRTCAEQHLVPTDIRLQWVKRDDDPTVQAPNRIGPTEFHHSTFWCFTATAAEPPGRQRYLARWHKWRDDLAKAAVWHRIVTRKPANVPAPYGGRHKATVSDYIAALVATRGLQHRESPRVAVTAIKNHAR